MKFLWINKRQLCYTSRVGFELLWGEPDQTSGTIALGDENPQTRQCVPGGCIQLRSRTVQCGVSDAPSWPAELGTVPSSLALSFCTQSRQLGQLFEFTTSLNVPPEIWQNKAKKKKPILPFKKKIKIMLLSIFTHLFSKDTSGLFV